MAGAILLVAVAAAATFLIQADPPWAGRAAERLAAGKKLRGEDYGMLYGWWAALVNLFILGVPLALFGWWAQPPRTSSNGLPAGRTRLPAYFWAALGAVVLVAGIWRVPRMDDSFWNDEEYAFRRYTWGEYERADPAGTNGTLAFDGHSLAERLFVNKTGNNHIAHTMEASLALAAWDAIHDPPQPDYSEAALRFFPLLSSFATIALVGIFGGMLGGPLVGIGAALLMALSPWHIRYSVEARGYSTMLMGIMGALICSLRALDTGRWRWWLGLAAAQALFLLSFAAAVYVAAGINLLILALLVHRLRSGRCTSPDAARWVVATLLSAAVVIQLMLPSAPQILAYLKHSAEIRAVELNWAWLRDFWTHLVAGVPPVVARPEVALGTGVDEMARARPWTAPAIYHAMPVMTLLGSALLVARGGVGGRLAAAALWGGALLAYLHNGIGHTEMYGWYLLYTAPALALSLAMLAAAAGRVRGWAGGVAMAATVLGYGYLTAPPRAQMASAERQPMAQVVEMVRGRAHDFLDPDDGGVLTGSFGVSDRQVQSYDPRVEVVETRAELASLVAKAGASGKTLYVYFCGRTETAERNPDVLALIDEPTIFEKVADVPGFEAYFSYEIYRLKRASPDP